MKTLIGLDYGSDSVRGVLISAEGEELASSVFNYPRWCDGKYSVQGISQFRQHPLDYLEGLVHVVREILKGQDASQVAGIGIDATGATPVAVNKDGVPLALLPDFADDPDAMFILWKDHTSTEEAARITEVAKNWGGPDYTQYTGGVSSSEWFWSKALHAMRVNPRVRAAAWKFVEHCDWLPALLTGQPVKASRAAAGHKAHWHPSWGGLPSNDFLVKVDPMLDGMRDRMYVHSYTSDTPMGTLTPAWAEKLGLPAGVVVAVGAFDAHSGAVGAGIQDGVDVKIMGTSSCDIMGAQGLEACIPGVCGQVDGSTLPGLMTLEAGQSSFGDTFAWFKRFLGYAGQVSLPQLEKEAMELPEDDTEALDWFNGRRTPVADYSVRGAIAGLNLGTTPPMVYRALVRATAFGSRAIDEHLAAHGVTIRRIIATGGIARKSPFVMQTMADVLGKPISVVRSSQTCALGTAIYAAAASGLYPNAALASEAIASPVETVYTPQKNYDRHYARYAALAAFCQNNP